jgi:hypothetical protein
MTRGKAPKRKPAKGKKLALKTPKKRGKGRPFKVGNKYGKGRPRKGADASAFADQAIAPEDVWQALAKQIRKGSITAIRTYLEYRHGKPWSEAEVLADREIKEAQARIDAAQKGNGNGDSKESAGKDAKGAGG